MKTIYGGLAIIITASILISCARGKTETADQDSTATGMADTTTTSNAPGFNDNDQNSYSNIENYLVKEAEIPAAQIQIIDSACAIDVSPTEEQMEKMKKEYGEEEFATIVDDASFYSSEVRRKLEGLNVKVIDAQKRYLKLRGAQTTWLLDIRKEKAPEWNLIFFQTGKEPKIFASVDLAGDTTAALVHGYFDLK